MEEQDYILFDQYLLEELSADERLVFEKRLDTDIEFKKSFNTYKELSNFLENKFENEEESNDFKSNLERVSNKHFSKTETPVDSKHKRGIFRIGQLAIAASVILFLGVFIFNQFSNPTYLDYNSHEPMTVVRGNVKDLIEATKAFNNEEYEIANKLIKKVLDKDPENSELKLYYAITNIELDNYKVADENLNELINGTSAYKDKALWYSALSRLKQRNIDACIILLKQVEQESEDYKQAQELLDKLE
ncbi:hypothetical protein [uncultured Lacinutrix sp.]|uniref:hypothetical protein n=1 Tax=uncultured Lacinutrix sp. TaxID=574032 RepID=UPI00261FB8DD|nr:hypothetical protein [uncultured Lacinutrix sp.]